MMNHEHVKARLNLNAVLSNLEDLVLLDEETATLVENWETSIQFDILGGGKAYLEFTRGTCRVRPGKHPDPAVKLFFFSSSHFNRMMDGKANPIPLKGLGKLGFLTKEFPKVTARLEYYLKPSGNLLEDREYMEINTRMTLNTAAFAIRELSLHDRIGQQNAARIGEGAVQFKILPDGHAVHLDFNGDDISVSKDEADRPMAVMLFRDSQVANDLLNGRSDAFAAVAGGDVMMRGRVSMIEPINIILDRIGHYLSSS